jgi:hypothetical protein
MYQVLIVPLTDIKSRKLRELFFNSEVKLNRRWILWNFSFCYFRIVNDENVINMLAVTENSQNMLPLFCVCKIAI